MANGTLFPKFFPLKTFHIWCFWALLKKATCYAQYYTHNYCNYATVHIIANFIILMTMLAQLGTCLLFFNFYLVCYAAVILYLTYCVPWKTSASVCIKLHYCCITKVSMIIVMISMSMYQQKMTFNYTDYFAVHVCISSQILLLY